MKVILPQYVISNAFNNSAITTAFNFTSEQIDSVKSKAAILQSCSVDTEPSTNLWDSTAQYTTGNTVYFLDTEGSCKGCWVQYEALQDMTIADSTTGKVPSDEPEFWTSLGTINRYKAFDQYNGSAATSSTGTNITMTIQCGKVTNIAFVNIQAQAIKIKAYDFGGSVIFDRTSNDLESANAKINLSQSCNSWFEYFFNDFEYIRTIVVPIDLYALNNMTLELTFEAYSGLPCKVGNIILGRQYDIGQLQYGVSTGIIDYSKKTFNETFGAHYFKEGNYRNTMDASLLVENSQLNTIRNILTQLRARPTIWQGNQEETEYDDLIIFGVAGRFNIIHQYYTHSECNLEIEGLI